MTEMVFDVSPTGQVEGLHFDKFPLNFLGHMEVTRATEILWDDMDQSWFVKPVGQSVPYVSACGFGTYEEARKFEVDWLQECRKQGVSAESFEGYSLSLYVRNGPQASIG